MKTLPFICVLMFASTAFAAEGVTSNMRLFRSGEKTLSVAEQKTILAWSETFLKSANFNTLQQADVLKQSIQKIQARYRDTVKGDYLEVTYDQPVTFDTVGGKITVVEIIVGLNRSDEFASGLFAVDKEGRVIALEKYAGLLSPELQKLATR